VGTAPPGPPHTGQQTTGQQEPDQPLTAEVERHLERLDHLPLAEHPRVYEQLDATIRRELETEPRA
jgi:hypothetical protein